MWAGDNEKELTSQTIMASWLVPFLPCWVNKDATSQDPFKNILPGILWSGSSLRYSKDEFREPNLFLVLFRFLTPTAGDKGEPGRGLLLSADKQDPILRALTIFSMHSRGARQSHPLFSIDGSVRNHLGEILQTLFSQFHSFNLQSLEITLL